MIHFLGIAFHSDRVDVCFVGRDLKVAHRRSTPIANASTDEQGCIRIPAPEWSRAATYLTRDSFLDLEVKKRKIWGVALASPVGWVALNRELKPASDIVLPPADDDGVNEVGPHIAAWFSEDDRRRLQTEAFLSPKDYLRFLVSGALANDVSSTSRTGLSAEDGSEWSGEKLEACGLERTQLGPVFECTARTGQLTDEGIEQLGVHSRLWMTAGAEISHCAQLSCGDPRNHLWVSAEYGRLRLDITSANKPLSPAGFAAYRSTVEGTWSLERRWSGDPAEIDAATQALKEAGHTIQAERVGDGDAALGAAMLAARSSGLVKDWDRIFSDLSKSADQ